MLELAREMDWEAIRHLSVQVHALRAALRSDIYYNCETPYPRDCFLEDIRNRMVYVAKAQGVVVGYVVLSVCENRGPGTVEKKQLRLDSICVDGSVRRHGIGRAMITDVRALAKAFGCREVILSVHAENDDAVVFYQKCGFTIRAITMDMKA